jgi:hypothetical protein
MPTIDPLGATAPAAAIGPRPPASGPVAPPSAAVLDAAVVDIAGVLAAKVVTPAAEVAGMPQAGDALALRLLALAAPGNAPALPPGAFAGTLLTPNGAASLLMTPLGLLALGTPLAAPAGSILVLRRAMPAGEPEDTSAAADLPADTLRLAAAGAAVDALQRALDPRDGVRLAAGLLVLAGRLRAVSDEERVRATATAGRAARGRTAAEPDADAPLAVDDPNGDAWSLVGFPLFDGEHATPLRLAMKRPASEDEPGDGARFLVEVELSRLGGLQLDGRVQARRFDLLLRTRSALTPDARAEIAALFHDAKSAAGFGGDIAFTTHWLLLKPAAAGRGTTILSA